VNSEVVSEQMERVYQIYDVLRTLLLNKKYYAERLANFQTYNFVMEMLIAYGTAGSGFAGFAVWQLAAGKIVWGLISSAAVILAIAKPLLRLTDRIEMYAKLYGEYTSAFARMKIPVDDIQIDKAIAPARIKLFEELRTRTAELSKLGDPRPDRDFVRRLQAQVIVELPIERLWLPGD
jgi:hypothetical protein